MCFVALFLVFRRGLTMRSRVDSGTERGVQRIGYGDIMCVLSAALEVRVPEMPTAGHLRNVIGFRSRGCCRRRSPHPHRTPAAHRGVSVRAVPCYTDRAMHRQRGMVSRDLVLQRAVRLFWDRPMSPTDLETYPRWVVSRVIHFGDLEG